MVHIGEKEVNEQNLIFVNYENRHLEMHFTSGKVVKISGKAKQLLQLTLEHKLIQINQSQFINPNYIELCHCKEVRLKGIDISFWSSRSGWSNVKEILKN